MYLTHYFSLLSASLTHSIFYLYLFHCSLSHAFSSHSIHHSFSLLSLFLSVCVYVSISHSLSSSLCVCVLSVTHSLFYLSSFTLFSILLYSLFLSQPPSRCLTLSDCLLCISVIVFFVFLIHLSVCLYGAFCGRTRHNLFFNCSKQRT